MGDQAKIPKEMLRDLAAVGFDVESPAEVRLKYKKYKEAIPVLVWWLVKIDDVAIKEDIVRNLTTKDAPPHALGVLNAELHKASDDSLRWAIGNAIGLLASKKDKSLLLQISGDPTFGRSRQMIVSALSKCPGADTEALLVSLLKDPDVKGHALGALAKVGGMGSASSVEQLIDDPSPWIRKKATITLRAITRKHPTS